jgi:hypothetical protein
MSPRCFCTLFDRNYLFKGIAMLESLRRHCPQARIFVLCMDDVTHDILGRLSYPHVELIRLAEVEDDALLAVKPGRGVAEYCWTLTPCLCWHVFETRSEVEQLTYLDADLLIYSPVEPLFAEIGQASIAIVEHRFIPRLQSYAINGRFNVEWVSFRRDEQGMACLSRWREQCIEWCFNRLEDGRMGDQKYLDEWPAMYPSLCILQHPGAGVAPWNFASYEIASGPAGITVDGVPLVFYHFHQLQMHRYGRFDYMANLYKVEKQPPAAIYAAYEDALRSAVRKVRVVVPGFRDGIQPLGPWIARRFIQNYFPRWLKSHLKRVVQT